MCAKEVDERLLLAWQQIPRGGDEVNAMRKLLATDIIIIDELGLVTVVEPRVRFSTRKTAEERPRRR